MLFFQELMGEKPPSLADVEGSDSHVISTGTGTGSGSGAGRAGASTEDVAPPRRWGREQVRLPAPFAASCCIFVSRLFFAKVCTLCLSLPRGHGNPSVSSSIHC